MNTWVRKSLNVGVLSAGFLLVASGAAHADSVTGNNTGAGDGNQLGTNGQAPVTVDGNSVAFLGLGDATDGGSGGAGASVADSSTATMITADNTGAGNGNQAVTNILAPVNVSGNAVGILGVSSASSGGSADAHSGGSAGHGGADAAGGTKMATGNNGGLITGNQVSTLLQAPVNACGNSIAVLGTADASCGGGSVAGGSAAGGSMTTGMNNGVASGNQIGTLLQAPINACGNSIAVLGSATASCGGGNGGGNGGGYNGGGSTGGYVGGGAGGYGAGSGAAVEQVTGAVQHSTQSAHLQKAAKTHNVKKAAFHKKNNEAAGLHAKSNKGGATAAGGAGALTTGDNGGILTGNQAATSILAPINLSGNAISVLGSANA